MKTYVFINIVIFLLIFYSAIFTQRQYMGKLTWDIQHFPLAKQRFPISNTSFYMNLDLEP